MSQEEDIQHGKYDPHRLIFHLSLVGVLICTLGMSAAIFALYWKMGWQMFTLHIDVLGDYLRSPLAFLYNVSLILAGGCFVLAMLGLYLLKYSRFTCYLAIAGINCGLGVMLIGIYPYNDPVPHQHATLFFICASMLMFGLLLACHFNHSNFCSSTLGLFSLLGLIISILLLVELIPFTITDHKCPVSSICYTSILMWSHTLITMLTGVGLAFMAKNLLNSIIT